MPGGKSRKPAMTNAERQRRYRERQRLKKEQLSPPQEPKAEKPKRNIPKPAFPCCNCGQLVDEPKLFCSDLCKQEAKYVRYVRRCRKDGRDKDPLVQDAIKTRLALILGGGYPARERQLSSEIREAVIRRDSGCCQICGQPGDEIDHIRGSSDDLDNLRLLCHTCHMEKTKASFVKITPDSPEWERIDAKAWELTLRTECPEPERLCDDEENWSSVWTSHMQERRQAFSKWRRMHSS